jgi:DNA-binding GntR family transcriptional regulator
MIIYVLLSINVAYFTSFSSPENNIRNNFPVQRNHPAGYVPICFFGNIRKETGLLWGFITIDLLLEYLLCTKICEKWLQNMKTDSFANKAYSEIRRKILSGQVLPDTRLKENSWAKKLEVGRMAVREALARLLGEGLVMPGEKGGYYIAGLTKEGIEEIRELRQILELGALELASQKISKREIKLLEKICDDFTAMASQGYFAGACEADIKFHEALVECSHNSKLISIYRKSHILLFHKKLGKTEAFLNDYKQTDAEHRQIVQALKTGNIASAKKTLIHHFERGAAAILELE